MTATIKDILIVQNPITIEILNNLAMKWHQILVKGVVDVNTGVMALGGEWHMDANNLLIERGLNQVDLWGFNIYPKETGNLAIEYISLINIRPSQNNRGMEIEDEGIREKIKELVKKIIPELKI